MDLLIKYIKAHWLSIYQLYILTKKDTNKYDLTSILYDELFKDIKTEFHNHISREGRTQLRIASIHNSGIKHIFIVDNPLLIDEDKPKHIITNDLFNVYIIDSTEMNKRLQ